MPVRLTLDDAAISRLAADPAVAKEFPLFRATVSRQPRSGCCSAAKAAAASGRAVRSAVLQMGREKQTRLKSLIRVDELVIPVVSGGTVRTHTV